MKVCAKGNAEGLEQLDHPDSRQPHGRCDLSDPHSARPLAQRVLEMSAAGTRFASPAPIA
jgi:hypothetical protein